MIQLFGSGFGQDASTWNFGKSLAKADEIDSAQTKSDGTIFMDVSPAPAMTRAGIPGMLCFQPAAIKGWALSFADLAKDFGGVLTETRGGVFGCRFPSVDDDRCTHAGNRAALGGLAGSESFMPR
jgi:hypothetical protein